MNRPLPPDPKQAHKSDRFLATASPTPTARVLKLRRLTVCPPGIAWGAEMQPDDCYRIWRRRNGGGVS